MDHGRYKLVRKLGDGTFGRVLLAEDCNHKGSQGLVAVKVVRGVKRYHENAKIELAILKRIREKDPGGIRSHSVVLLDDFDHMNTNLCMVFPPCGSSLYDVLKLNSYRGFWLQDIQHMSKQVCQGLSYLHNEMGLTHTDLKPENVLLCSMQPLQLHSFPRERSRGRDVQPYMRPVNCDVKLIDFGNATFRDEHHTSVINTRQYRGPEVLMGAGWDEQSDVWSMACVIIEMYTGSTLYAARSDEEHLAMMEITAQRPLPQPLLEGASREAKNKLLEHRCGRWRSRAVTGQKDRIRKQRTVESVVEDHHRSFQSLVDDMLELDPHQRPTMADVLTHNFWQQYFVD